MVDVPPDPTPHPDELPPAVELLPLGIDEIGPWSEIKLEIIRRFAEAYAKVLGATRLQSEYIDGFAGAGVHLSKTTRAMVAGSPLHAMQVQPPFKTYHLIDLDGTRANALRELAKGRNLDVRVYEGDCNDILLQQVLPQIRYDAYRRALCLLDPYGLHLRFDVVRLAGQLGTVDMLLNFPIADMNRNVLRRRPETIDPAQAARMTAFWGDESWREAAYRLVPTLFGGELDKQDNRVVVDAYCQRLRDAAGFRYVAPPVAMKNSQNAVVYYLVFGTANATADRIIKAIFKRYRTR